MKYSKDQLCKIAVGLATGHFLLKPNYFSPEEVEIVRSLNEIDKKLELGIILTEDEVKLRHDYLMVSDYDYAMLNK